MRLIRWLMAGTHPSTVTLELPFKVATTKERRHCHCEIYKAGMGHRAEYSKDV